MGKSKWKNCGSIPREEGTTRRRREATAAASRVACHVRLCVAGHMLTPLTTSLCPRHIYCCCLGRVVDLQVAHAHAFPNNRSPPPTHPPTGSKLLSPLARHALAKPNDAQGRTTHRQRQGPLLLHRPRASHVGRQVPVSQEDQASGTYVPYRGEERGGRVEWHGGRGSMCEV